MDTSTPASEAPTQPVALKPTLLSTVSDAIRSLDASFFPTQSVPNLHLFSPVPPNVDALNYIVHLSSVMSTTISSYHLNVQDPKYIARTQEYTNHADAYLAPRSHALLMMEKVASRQKLYGLDTPSDQNHIAQWVELHIRKIFKDAGMEHFQETEINGRTTLTGAGTSLVIDISLERHSQPLSIALKSLKINLASNGESESVPAAGEVDLRPMEALLRSSLDAFLKHVQLPDADHMKSEALSNAFKNHVVSLMKLDTMSAIETAKGGGNRWFNEIGAVSKMTDEISAKEAEKVARSLGTPTAPLDVFLNRAHALGLPYLSSLSLTFLVHVSPQAYLTLTRGSTPSEASPIKLDIDVLVLRDYLTKNASNPRLFTIATLSISSVKVASSPTILTPSFPLLIDTLDPMNMSVNPVPESHLGHTFISTDSQGFILELPGMVMRREALTALTMGDLMMGMSIGSGYTSGYGNLSWVDLLIDPNTKISYPRYFSSYACRKDVPSHPMLKLTLANPGELGFFFGKIRVTRMAEVWRVLEIVREQCWLNDFLYSFEWEKTAIEKPDEAGEPSGGERGGTAEADLDALMNGTYVPSEIPVQLRVIANYSSPSIHFTMPLPGVGAPLLSFSVSHDPLNPRGVRIDIPLPAIADAAAEQETWEKIVSWKETMEEIVRRGGGRLLCGWLWRKLSLATLSG